MRKLKLITSFVLVVILSFSISVYAADWPGDSGVVIGDGTNLGFEYEPSGLAYHSRLDKLVLVGDGGDITTINIDGSGVDTWSDTSNDLEGVAIADPNTDYVYVGVENPDSIKSFNLSTKAYGEKQWDLTSWMTGDPNSGLEALTFVPNGAHPYTNKNSSSGGFFYAGLQYDGKIYVFDVDLSTSGSVTYIDTITVNDSYTDISGLDYNSETGLVYAIYDTLNLLVEMEPDGTVVHIYNLPGDSQEGVSVVSSCPSTSSNIYIAQDSGDVWAYNSYPIVCLEDEDSGEDGEDTGDDSDDSSDTSDDSSDDTSDDSSDNSSDASTTTEDTASRTTEEGNTISPKIITTSGPGEVTRAQVYDRKGVATGDVITGLFPDSYAGGAGMVPIDANNNGVKDQALIFAINNGGPQARVIGIKEDKSVSYLGQQFVFDSSIRDGLSAMSGDFDNDGYQDDAAFCLTGDYNPRVKIFRDVSGIDNWKLINQFDAAFGAAGCNLGTFQYDDGAEELLITPNHGLAEPKVWMYTVGGTLKKDFWAYDAPINQGLTASGIQDRIYTTPNNGSSQINVFDKNGNRKNFWWAYQEHIRGDYTNVAGDIDLDGVDELLVSPIGSNGPQVLAYEPSGKLRSWPNFFAFGDEALRNGVGIAVIDNYHGVN